MRCWNAWKPAGDCPGRARTYWDRLGWKDRFSAEAFTLRQEEYVRRFRIDSAYTPQMVVNGRRNL